MSVEPSCASTSTNPVSPSLGTMKSTQSALTNMPRCTGVRSTCGPNPRANDERRLCDLVEKLVDRLTDALQPQDVPHGEIRIGDVPADCRDLMFYNPVLHRRAANPWPTFPNREEDVQAVRDLRREVVDVGIP